MVGYGGNHKMAPAGGGKFQFVKKENRADNDAEGGGLGGNMASRFAGKALRSEMAKADGQLQSDFESVLKGEAIYLPNFHCSKKDFSHLAGLAKDMEEHEAASDGGGMINWSKHLKHENPEFSPTFKRIVEEMSAHFDVEVYATRLNFYRDGTDWKPFHHDSHAYGGREKREDFTMGASFGFERELTFLHEPSGQQFSFPQNNGDVFAFTTEVNKRFKHGVPKIVRGIGGPRFSIIAWGRRRSLNANNGGAGGGTLRQDGGDGGGGEMGRAAASAGAAPAPVQQHPAGPEKVNELVMGSGEVSELIRTFLQEEERRGELKKQQQHQRQRQQRQKGGGGGGGSMHGGVRAATPTATALAAAADDAVAAAAAAAAPLPPPPATPGSSAEYTSLASASVSVSGESRGSAPAAAALRSSLGEDVYLALRSSARRYQRGEMTAEAFYDEATVACGGCWAPIVEITSHLPCQGKRSELLACHARREFS